VIDELPEDLLNDANVNALLEEEGGSGVPSTDARHMSAN
jgi:hypothetical protein